MLLEDYSNDNQKLSDFNISLCPFNGNCKMGKYY